MSAQPLKINFAGDLCLYAIDVASFRIDESLRRRFDTADLNVANLECPMTTSAQAMPNQPCHLKAEPTQNPIIDLFDAFSLANNHILDYSRKGFEDTLAYLTSQGKAFFGAGLNQADASAPLLLERRGYRVALLGFTRWYNARGSRCGTARLKLRRLVRSIRRLKSEGYFVVVYPHWNYEHVDYPAPVERKRAKRLLAAGADLIVGAHPHTIQGYEVQHGKHLFHSLGNFVFHSSAFPEPRRELFETAVVSVEVRPDHRYSVEVIPIQTHDDRLRLMDEAEAREFRARLDALSQLLTYEREYKRRFYASAKEILKHTMRSLSMTSKDGSALLALLRRLPRVHRQDIYIQLHAWFRE